MRVCLFEDQHVQDLEPIALTRPAYELVCGLSSLAERQWRHFGPCSSAGVLVRPHLEAVQREERQGVAVNNLRWLHADVTVLVNARWLPPAGQAVDLSRPCVALVGDEVAYAVVGPELLEYCSPNTTDECLDVWKQKLDRREAGGTLFRHLWEVVDQNGSQLIADFEAKGRFISAVAGPGVAVVGPRERVLIDPTATLDPMVVLDATCGPVVISAGARIGAFTRLEGPCHVGRGTHVLGAKIRSGTTLGPCCRVGGEVEASIVHGHSNKYHDGFLGHSYVGEWVNLGAGTSNSDLRNDYGPVTMTVAGQRVETGRRKIGCYLGDHTKSGLGSLLNTGTSVGVFTSLLPCGGFLPQHVPSYCVVRDGIPTEIPNLDGLIATAGAMMARRDQSLGETRRELYLHLHSLTARARQRSLREREQARLRRTA
jgi:UDP-N-acetylglucosamine diphosphorylase/glucosamine-1-phosphate N-acetyltransferase